MKLTVVDLLVVAYLILIPFFHLLFFKFVNISALVVQGAYGLSYFSLRILTSDLKPIELVNALTEIIVIIVCFQLLVAIAQHIGFMPSYYPIFGATGMFFNPGPFAIFTSALIAFVYILWIIKLLKRQYGWLAFYTLILGVGVYFVVLSLSRSAWIGLFVGIFLSSLIILFINNEAFFRRNKIFIRVCVSILFLALIPISLFLYEMKADSANGRALVWKATGLMINDSWNKGVGIGNFAPEYVHYQAAYFNQSEKNIERYGQLAGDSRYAFNDLLHTFAESGLIGLLLFLAIVIYLFFISIRLLRLHKAKHWAILLICGSMASIIVILVSGLTTYPLQMIPINILFWFLIAIIVWVHPTIMAYSFNLRRRLLLGSVLLLFSSLYLYYFKVKTRAYLLWENEEKKEVRDIDTLLFIYPILNTSPYYLLRISKEYIKQEKYGEAIIYLRSAINYSPEKEFYYSLGKCYEKQGDILQAEKIYALVQQAIPNLLKPYYLIAMMHYDNGDVKTFKAKAQEAIDFSPKINNIEVMEMKQRLRQLLLELDL